MLYFCIIHKLPTKYMTFRIQKIKNILYAKSHVLFIDSGVSLNLSKMKHASVLKYIEEEEIIYGNR